MPKILNRARMTTATTGAGTVTLGAAVSGFQTFVAAGALDGDVLHYAIEDGVNWEIGRGTYISATPALSRVFEASSTGSLLSLSGSATVFVTASVSAFDDLTRPRSLARRVAIMGHSIPSYTTVDDGLNLSYGSSYLHWALMLSGQRFVINHALNKGGPGQTTAQIAARFNVDIIANQNSFDILALDCGTNDLFGEPTVTKETTVANIKSMAQQAIDLGKFVIVMGIWPRNDQATFPKAYAYVNRQVMEWCRTKPGVIFIDPFFLLADTTRNDGFAASGMLTDGIHPTSYASYLIGQYLWAVIEPFFAGLPTQWRNGADLYDATTNPGGNGYPNPLLSGTGGSVSQAGATSSTGTVPTGTQTYKGAGSATTASAVNSVGPNTDGSPGNYHQFRFDAATGASTEEFYIGGWINLSTLGLAVGDQVYAQVEMELVGTANQLKQLELRMSAGDAGFSTIKSSNARLVEQVTTALTIPGKFVVRTMPLTLPVNTTQVNFNVFVAFDATLPAYGIIRYSQPQIRKVV